jgi:hypothetical protein
MIDPPVFNQQFRVLYQRPDLTWGFFSDHVITKSSTRELIDHGASILIESGLPVSSDVRHGPLFR